MMLDRTYDPRTLDDLAALVVHARINQDWDISGVKAALRKAAARDQTMTLGKLAHVALTVASMPTAQTPALIALDGDHWHPDRVNASNVLGHIDFTEACTVCLKDREHLWHGATGTVNDHDWTPPQPAVRAPLSLRERIQRMTDEREPV